MLHLKKPIMKSKLSLLIAVAVIFSSCQEEEVRYTGTLVVTSGNVENVSGTPIHLVSVDVYSENIGPLYQGTFFAGKVKFEVNPGNYVVRAMGYTKPVQVRVGHTSTIDIFQ